jgi:hypothetical protein
VRFRSLPSIASFTPGHNCCVASVLSWSINRVVIRTIGQSSGISAPLGVAQCCVQALRISGSLRCF